MSRRDDSDKGGDAAPSASVEQGRRDFLKGGVAAAGAGLAAASVPGVSAAAGDDCQPENPYGARPGGGISLPEYYKPWPAIKNRNMYLPGTEILPKNEMRITFLGSTPWPPNRLQKGTSMLVELGNGTPQPRRFFFDLGNGSIAHAIALQVPAALINDIFISHLHSDHFADLPYMYPFRAFSGGFTPLRVYGPSGRTPERGIKHMVEHMRAMNRWHVENFSSCPVGDGMEIEVTEFDWRERNGICYDKDGVTVRTGRARTSKTAPRRTASTGRTLAFLSSGPLTADPTNCLPNTARAPMSSSRKAPSIRQHPRGMTTTTTSIIMHMGL